MAQRFFIVPVQSSESAEGELNAFLSSHKVLTIDRRWVDLRANLFWAFCIDFIPAGGVSNTRSSQVTRSRVDYKEVLTTDEFAVFSQLRQLRKDISQTEAIPVYTVSTNEQLAQIVQQRWFDRFVKESLRVRGYVRYMDDMVLWHDDPTVLKMIRSQCEEFLDETLALDVKPMILQRTSVGVDFLGCRIWPTHVGLSRRSKRRWQRRVSVLQRAQRLHLISELDLQTRLEAATAFAKGAGANSWRFRRAVLQRPSVDGP